jgi:lipoprotein-releasing system permease protein
MSRVVVFIALRQLWARKLLNGIAVMAVTLGVVTLITISGITQGFQHKFLDNILRISPHVTIFDKELRSKVSLLSRFTQEFVAAHVSHDAPSDREQRIRRPSEIIQALLRQPEVSAATGLVIGPAFVSYGAQRYPVELRGIDPAQQDLVTPISKYIVSGNYQGIESGAGVLLGVGVANRVGAKVADYVTVSSHKGEARRLKVMGIFDCDILPVNNTRIYTVLADGQAILDKPNTIGRIEIRLHDEARAVQLSQQLEHRLGYDAESWQESNSNFLTLFEQQNTISGFVVAAILAVGGFAILAIQIMIVLQKRRDIAILRSVGFQRQDVLLGFVLQGAAIASLGALIGDVLGHGLLSLLATLKMPSDALVKSDTFMVFDDPSFYVYGAIFALSLGIVASVIPAIHGSRVEPVDVLRGEI